ncbi:MAG: tRNA dihydrouridine synthase DusB [Oscillospiraceae bacterium]|nr:tRNA dihydrouridine synthase DusB [Oscillospiraceae bacterium]
MKIGNIEIKSKAILAPLAGVADRAFREVCRSFGAGLAYSEMTSSKGVTMGDRKSRILMDVSNDERPRGIQIFGDGPAVMGESVKTALEYLPDIIDINMGCPVPKVVKNGGGAALMQNPALAGKIIESVAKAAGDVPVTVKIRKGFDNGHINAAEIAKIAENSGAAAVTVHGRTREQMYSPPVDLEIIKAVKEAVKIPVIGNGDVTGGLSAKKMLDCCGVDLVMVGRGALGRPYVFEEINAFLAGREYKPPDIAGRMEIMLSHINKILEYKGEKVGFQEIRKHALWYTKGIKGAAAYRRELSNISSMDELMCIVCEITNKY